MAFEAFPIPTVVASKSTVGLGNVDNTSDADKPVSTAQAAAIAEVGALLPQPSYANAGGTGDRTSAILVTASSGLTANSISNLVDGATGANSTDAIAFAAVAAAGHYIQFDFGGGAERIVAEATWLQSNTSTHGVWRWQASSDADVWADIGATFALGGATSQVQTELSANTSGYRFYRLLGVIGTASSSPWVQEVQFKIASSITEGYALSEADVPEGFPLSKLVAGYLFDEAVSADGQVADLSSAYPLDLTLPATPNVELTARGVKLSSGLVQTPLLPSVRAQTILYRVGKDELSGMLISGGAGSGSATTAQNITTTETHKIAGFGLDVAPVGALAAGGGAYALNRGGWAMYHREMTANYTDSFGLGGRHSTTTSRCADFECNCAFFWNATLTDAELAAVHLYVRRRAVAAGITIHRDDLAIKADLYALIGESNADGRALISGLSAADQAASYRNTTIAASTGNIGYRFDTLELGFNQKEDNGFSVATLVGPEIGIATARRAASRTNVRNAAVLKSGKGGTRTAPSSTGIAAANTWNAGELKSDGLLWLSLRTFRQRMQELVASGVGFGDTVRIGFLIGLNDATSTTYTTDAATYQGRLQAIYDEMVTFYAGMTVRMVIFRAHTSDPSSDATALGHVRTGTDAFAAANANVSVVDTDAYALEADLVHYDAAGVKQAGISIHDY